MNKETYEALKRITKDLRTFIYQDKNDFPQVEKDLKQIETWIDEVAKEYN